MRVAVMWKEKFDFSGVYSCIFYHRLTAVTYHCQSALHGNCAKCTRLCVHCVRRCHYPYTGPRCRDVQVGTSKTHGLPSYTLFQMLSLMRLTIPVLDNFSILSIITASLLFFVIQFLQRVTMLSAVYSNSVRASVCPFATRRYCVINEWM